jgi:hypothetical protein
VYHSLLPRLSHFPPAERSAILSGRRFTALADFIIVVTTDAYLQERVEASYGEGDEEMEYFRTLPELRVTPPDDGHRKPQPGEKKGGKTRVEKGLLAPPARKIRTGKQMTEKGKRQRIEKMKLRMNRSIGRDRG